ncbi:hypothetical protein E4U55_001361 [Claviceps digitariae]|nr:hypothetical protein E4U55_001361 [Claviceps digitariae]
MDEVRYASSLNDPDPQPLASLSSWHNIPTWVLNVTRNTPFVEVIVLAGPRMFNKLGSYLAVSGSMDSREQLAAPPPRSGLSEVREQNIYNILEPSFIYETIQITAPDDQVGSGNAARPLFIDGARGIGSVFSYATSKWAISCIAMAIILNRTYIFAATRRRLRFLRLLRSIQCQSSPDFNEFRWLDRSKTSDLASAYPNIYLNKLSSALLLGASDRQSCEAIDMVPHSDRGTGQYRILGTLLYGINDLERYRFRIREPFATKFATVSDSPTTESLNLNLRQRLANAHGNMQANMSLAAIHITRDMDFYTALLRTGFTAITMASEAVYLNEERSVNVQRHTWLEEARFREVEELRSQDVGMRFANDYIGTIGLIPVKEGTKPSASGFGRERAAQKVTRGRSVKGGGLTTGVMERSSTWVMALEYLLNITRLFGRVGALSLLWFLGLLRFRRQPACLLWLARSRKPGTGHRASMKENPDSLKHTSYSPGKHVFPHIEGIDVEYEFRQANVNQDEDSLDAELYNYWASGGWWGVDDMSGDYIPKESSEVWDTTSVLSTSSFEADDEVRERPTFKHDNHDNLRQTSTTLSCESRAVTEPIWDTNHLARLLHPATVEEKEEAQALSAHLQCDKVMTRSAFRRHEQARRSRVLLHPGIASHNMSVSRYQNTRLSPDDEDQALDWKLKTVKACLVLFAIPQPEQS